MKRRSVPVLAALCLTLACPGQTPDDAGPENRRDSGYVTASDSGAAERADAGAGDGGRVADASIADAGRNGDAGTPHDAGEQSDAAFPDSGAADAAQPPDASVLADAGTFDAGPPGPMPDFALLDVNSTSGTFAQAVSPRDYFMKVSGWYFGHAT